AQQRKVPFMAAMFASLAFEPEITPAYAHYLIRLAGRLSYRQLAAIAYFAENAGSRELDELLADREVRGHPPFPEGLDAELVELGQDASLLGITQSDGTVVPTRRTYAGVEGDQIANLAPTDRGRLVYDLMELSRIP